MKKWAVLRFVLSAFLCFSIILYNGFDLVKPSVKTTQKTAQKSNILLTNEVMKTENIQTEKKEDKKENTLSTPQKTEEEAVKTSADAIKGKIISQYISPYKTSPSYNNVYLKNSTNLNINLKELLSSNLSFKIKKNSGAQVLIIHTHTTETFMTENTDYFTENFKSRTTDNSKNMVSIGNIIAEKLNNAGIKTIHDKTKHDYPNYTGSYSRAAKTITSHLNKNPDIKVVLDLHRDAVTRDNGDKVKLVTEINGKKAAQVMIVMGSQSGSVTNFPKWKENLKLAVKLQQILEVKYPTLARPLSLTSKNYNESLTTGSMLIEFGTDANTLEEAKYSAELVSNALVELFNSLE